MVQEINQPFLTYRVKFVKLGSLQYISHLDLVRTMNKVLIRTKLPLWYSEGFNPKPKMVFSLPLSIGAQSMSEYMDIRLTSRVDENTVLTLINENVTEELRALEVYCPETKLSDIKWYSYQIKIKTKLVSEELVNKCNSELNKENLIVEKNSKKGISTIDIKPMIKYADSVLDGDMISISAILSSDSGAVLNPELFIKALNEKCNFFTEGNLLEEYYTIMRLKAYTEDMNEYK